MEHHIYIRLPYPWGWFPWCRELLLANGKTLFKGRRWTRGGVFCKRLSFFSIATITFRRDIHSACQPGGCGRILQSWAQPIPVLKIALPAAGRRLGFGGSGLWTTLWGKQTRRWQRCLAALNHYIQTKILTEAISLPTEAAAKSRCVPNRS